MHHYECSASRARVTEKRPENPSSCDRPPPCSGRSRGRPRGRRPIRLAPAPSGRSSNPLGAGMPSLRVRVATPLQPSKGRYASLRDRRERRPLTRPPLRAFVPRIEGIP